MKKIFLAVICSMAITGYVMAHGNNLFQHFRGALPSLASRSVIYVEVSGEKYLGTAEQNATLHKLLDRQPILGGFAPLPGPVVEGTSTAGWTDDGSVVRLNTAADSVIIGSLSGPSKLSVIGGAIYASGNLAIGGGTFDFGTGAATSTLTVIAGGAGFSTPLIGIGTTTPRNTLAVQGGLIVSGSTTVAAITATGTIATQGNLSVSGTTKLNGVEYTWPSADGTNNQVLATNGSRTLSWSSSSRGSVLLGSFPIYALNPTIGATTTLATTTVAANDFTRGEILRVTAYATSTIHSTAGFSFNLNLSYGGFATSTCGVFHRLSPSSATSTITFIIRANETNQQSNRCTTQLISSQGTVTDNTVPGGNAPEPGGAGNRDFSNVIGTVSSASSQPLILEYSSSGITLNSQDGLSIYGVIIELLNL